MRFLACWFAHFLTGWWSWRIDPLPRGSWVCEKCHVYRWPQWYADAKARGER